ncbi:MAG: hypothetical protein LUH05_03085 [Candidatus Gastranaerophilales bacterium]|nr:hypothetical protein [Candidatus Gastranaerophilales bacterium]
MGTIVKVFDVEKIGDYLILQSLIKEFDVKILEPLIYTDVNDIAKVRIKVEGSDNNQLKFLEYLYNKQINNLNKLRKIVGE